MRLYAPKSTRPWKRERSAPIDKNDIERSLQLLSDKRRLVDYFSEEAIVLSIDGDSMIDKFVGTGKTFSSPNERVEGLSSLQDGTW